MSDIDDFDINLGEEDDNFSDFETTDVKNGDDSSEEEMEEEMNEEDVELLEEENNELEEGEEEEEKNVKKGKKKLPTFFNPVMSTYEYHRVVSERAKQIDRGYMSYCHEEILEKQITNSISIAQYEFENNKLNHFVIERSFPNGGRLLVKISDFKYFPKVPTYKPR